MKRTDKSIKILVIIVLSMTIVVLGWFIYAIIYPYFAIQSQYSTTSKVGKAIMIVSIPRDANGYIKVYVQNVGDTSVTLSEIYVDGVLDGNAIPTGIPLSQGNTAGIDLTYPNMNPQVRVKVVTEDGTSIQMSKNFP